MTVTLTDLTLDRLAPWLTPAADPAGDHATYLRAISVGEQLFSLIWDQGDVDDADYQPGWGQLTDVDAIPLQFLPWLAQMVGVPASALAGQDDATARQIVRAEQGQQRGTPAAIVAAAKRFLSGTKSVTLIERTDPNGPNAYAFQLIVRPEELSLGAAWDDLTEPWSVMGGTWSGSDQTAPLTDAVNAVKPAGLTWTLVKTDGYTWSAALNEWSADTFMWSQTANTQP